MKFIKLKSSKMSEAVADQVLKLINDGSLKTGDKLPIELELAASLGVSRTAIREGMARLHAMGLIEILPGRGTFISKLPNERTLKIKRKKIEDVKTLIEAFRLRSFSSIWRIPIFCNISKPVKCPPESLEFIHQIVFQSN